MKRLLFVFALSFLAGWSLTAQVNIASEYATEVSEFMTANKVGLDSYLSNETKRLIDKGSSLTESEKSELEASLRNDLAKLNNETPELSLAYDALVSSELDPKEIKAEFNNTSSWPCIPNEAACRRSTWLVDNSWWLGVGALAAGLAGQATHCDPDCE